MANTNKERLVRDAALQELEELSLLLESDPEVIDSMSIDDVRVGLRKMGLNPDTPLNVRASMSPQNPIPWPETLTSSSPVEVFISYARRDEELLKELVKHLANLERQGVITDWHDRMIVPGSKWAEEIDNQLNKAKVFLLLVSPDFMASDYC